MAWTSVWGVEKFRFDIISPRRGHRNMPWKRKSADTRYSGPSANTQLMTLLRKEIHYSPMLQFMLEDAQRRTFVTQRYCFRGAIDDWVYIGTPGKLATLVQKYVRHLGKESYFDLM